MSPNETAAFKDGKLRYVLHCNYRSSATVNCLQREAWLVVLLNELGLSSRAF